MITIFFLGFVALMTAAIVALSARYRNGRFAFGVLAALCAWFIYVGVLGYLGVIANTAMFPPGIALIFVPVVAFLVLFILRVGSSAGVRMALVFPVWVLIGTQAFRVGIELFIHQLWVDGLVPKMLTFAGANVDIYIGASAPVIAWLSMRGGWGQRLALLWNLLGLLSLANVVTRAVLTARRFATQVSHSCEIALDLVGDRRECTDSLLLGRTLCMKLEDGPISGENQT